MQLNHVGISVANLERSMDFYKNVIGMEIAAAPFPLVGDNYQQIMALNDLQARMCVMRKGSFLLELFEFSRPEPASKDSNYSVADRGISHFGIEVSDIRSEYDRLSAAGVRFHSPVLTFPSGIKATYGRDLDGNVFELLEMPKSSDGNRR